MDEEGYFSIVDRSKDMLNVGGFKVFSRGIDHLWTPAFAGVTALEAFYETIIY